MTRGWKIAIGVGSGVLALNGVLLGLRALTGGEPGGPSSSSYATGADGLAAYADLLAAHGHRVERLRVAPGRASLDPATTLVVVDPGFVLRDDARSVVAFVRAGGRLVAAGQTTEALYQRVAGGRPIWSDARLRHGSVVAPVPELARVSRLETRGGGIWSRSGAALPAYAGSAGSLVSVAARGSGRAFLIANPSLLQNNLLDEADNAALGTALAGAPGRKVVFAESYHGYGEESGVAAIPARWKALFGVGALALAVFVFARGRRLGPAEEEARDLPPPRIAYVESLGGVLARARGREAAAARLQGEARRLLAARGLDTDAAPDRVQAMGSSLGLGDDEVAALVRPAASADLIAVGRALARLVRMSTRRNAWRT